MTSARILLSKANSVAIGRLPAADWFELEKALGVLPSDYKDIVSTFGLGSFGDMVLFHPAHSSDRLRLPNACLRAREFLAGMGSAAVNGALTVYPLILADVASRRYLLHGAPGWAILDFEMERVNDLGGDLVSFISEAYDSLTHASPLSRLASTIWKGSPDGGTEPLFRPAR